MRSILGFLGVLLIPVSHAFAADSPLDRYCGSHSPPEDCIAYADAAFKEHSRFLKANAENHPIIDFCFTTKDPPGCITSFRTNQPDAYALEIAHMEQQLAQEEARYKALLQEQASLSDETRPNASKRTTLRASANKTLRSSFIPNRPD